MTGVYFNKAQALREKEAAERLIASKNYVEARDKLLQARQLFPSLAGIAAMLAVSDILAASKNNIPGYDIDYYWVLHIMPSSSSSEIISRHQKLLNLLLPIKNKFLGTELALKLIDDAFSVLSDVDKRLLFDLKRKSCWDGYESSDVHLFRENRTSSQSSETLEGKKGVLLQKEIVKDSEADLFANHDTEAHVSVNIEELGASSSDVSSDKKMAKETPSLSSDLSLQRLNQDLYDFGEDRNPLNFEMGQIWAAHYRSNTPQNNRYAQITANSISSFRVTWLKPVPITIAERRWCNAGLPVSCGSFFLDLENTETVSSHNIFSNKCSWICGITEDQFEIYPQKGEIWAVYEEWDLDEWSYNPEIIEGCKLRFVEFLSDFSKYLGAKCAYLEKVNGFRSIFKRQTEDGVNPVILHISPSNSYMLSHKVPTYRFMGGEINGVIFGMLELDLLALPNYKMDDTDGNITSNGEKSESSKFSPSSEELLSLPLDNTYPENQTMGGANWSMNDVTQGQIWALYGEKDLMPRKYARVDSINSSNQVYVTFLEGQPILDHEMIGKKEKLPVVCGTYAATGTSVNLKMSQLSHLVRCLQRPGKSIYRIYPMKGQIWAMYRNWENKWKRFDYENSELDVVEILSYISEGSGVAIARLREVQGCLTFFHRQHIEGFVLTRVVSKADMLSFSHQIPAFRVPGIGKYGIPESSWHLEPNALPCKLVSHRGSI